MKFLSLHENGYASAVSDGRYVFVSQLLPQNTKDNIHEQAKRLFVQLNDCLASMGSGTDHLLQLTITVPNHRSIAAVQTVYRNAIAPPGPAVRWQYGYCGSALLAMDAVALCANHSGDFPHAANR